VENLGSDRYVYGMIPALDPEAKVIAKVPSTLPASVAAPGSRERFTLDRDRLRYFDVDSGARCAPSGAPIG